MIDRAGVSKSQLYHYFEDRAALLRAVVDHNTERVIRHLGAVDDSWKAIRAWLDSMLDPRADPDELATATMAGTQGGLLLTQTRRDPRQLAIALDAAYAHLRAHAASERTGVTIYASKWTR